jgi:hypothetical protein
VQPDTRYEHRTDPLPEPIRPGVGELRAALESFARDGGLPDDLARAYATEALALVNAYADPLGILPDPPPPEGPAG